MRAKTLGAMVAVGLVVAAAGFFVGSSVSIQKYPHKGDDCRGRDCSIVIKFACGVFTCEAYPDKEVVLTDPNHKIEFEVDSTTTHEFDTDGIKFTSSNSTGWFPCQAQGKTKYKCDIKDKTPAGLYKYRILIKGLSEVDPWVVNY